LIIAVCDIYVYVEKKQLKFSLLPNKSQAQMKQTVKTPYTFSEIVPGRAKRRGGVFCHAHRRRHTSGWWWPTKSLSTTPKKNKKK